MNLRLEAGRGRVIRAAPVRKVDRGGGGGRGLRLAPRQNSGADTSDPKLWRRAGPLRPASGVGEAVAGGGRPTARDGRAAAARPSEARPRHSGGL